MPELPEVETVVAGLRNVIVNRAILEIEISGQPLRAAYPSELGATLKGRSVTAVTRRAKYIVVHMGSEHKLIIHLGMTGRLLVVDDSRASSKHDHAVFFLSGGKKLIFNDPRRFGLIALTNCADLNDFETFKRLGPEPLTDEFDCDHLLSAIKRKRASIKSALMDSHVVVGVGNIYACESLFHAGIAPTRPACSLNEAEATRLVACIKETLLAAIAACGSTLRNYVRADGRAGGFQNKFRVYGKFNKPCYACGALIKKLTVAGRSSFYCPGCQA